ncbi:MAG: sugar transporter substrate-binding protein [Caulobacteraceae bacterium]|nr:sugar transporter substrate-binding protein [Caulobacteraceae bacterium]
MRKLALALCLALAACAPRDDGRTHLTIQRFFGACETDYGAVTDVGSAEGECGIMTTLLNRFSAENRDIALRTNIVAWPGYDQLTAQLAANDAPDLVTMHASVIPDYQARGLLEPLGPDLAQVGIDPASFTAAGRRAVTIDGKIWGLPLDTWAPLWHINMNLFRQAGLVSDGQPVLPHSPDELLAQAEQFKQRTGKPYFVMISANEYPFYTRNFYTLLMQQNAVIFPDPKHIRVQTPEARQALGLLKTLHDRGLTTLNQDYSAGTAAFLNGAGGVQINGTWMVGDFEKDSKRPDSPLKDGYAVMTFPQLFPGREATFADDHVWVMPVNRRRTPSQKAAALRFLKFFASHDFDWGRTGHLPAMAGVIDSPEFRALPHRDTLIGLADTGQTLPKDVRRQSSIETIVGEESAAAISGAKSIDKALADMERRINTLLESV